MGCRRRGRSRISSPNVLGMHRRLGALPLEHKKVVFSVDVVVLEKMTKVRRPKVKVRTLTMSKHSEQASRSASSIKSNTPTCSRNVPPSLTSASTMDNDYPLHAISQQQDNRSTSESNWSMQAPWTQTSTSWFVDWRPTSRATQLWAKSDEEREASLY
jgi:hypothetical protein